MSISCLTGSESQNSLHITYVLEGSNSKWWYFLMPLIFLKKFIQETGPVIHGHQHIPLFSATQLDNIARSRLIDNSSYVLQTVNLGHLKPPLHQPKQPITTEFCVSCQKKREFNTHVPPCEDSPHQVLQLFLFCPLVVCMELNMLLT